MMICTVKSAVKPVTARCGGDAVFLPFLGFFPVFQGKLCINISNSLLKHFEKNSIN